MKDHQEEFERRATDSAGRDANFMWSGLRGADAAEAALRVARRLREVAEADWCPAYNASPLRMAAIGWEMFAQEIVRDGP